MQIGLPLRHHFIEGNVLRTEEGHRLSWRMMLRVKRGRTSYWVVNKDTGKRRYINLNTYLSKKQKKSASTKPDVMWQFAQRLKQEFKDKGEAVSVHINSKISINGKPYQPFINSEIDIANEPWSVFRHSSWILPLKEE